MHVKASPFPSCTVLHLTQQRSPGSGSAALHNRETGYHRVTEVPFTVILSLPNTIGVSVPFVNVVASS